MRCRKINLPTFSSVVLSSWKSLYKNYFFQFFPSSFVYFHRFFLHFYLSLTFPFISKYFSTFFFFCKFLLLFFIVLLCAISSLFVFLSRHRKFLFSLYLDDYETSSQRTFFLFFFFCFSPFFFQFFPFFKILVHFFLNIIPNCIFLKFISFFSLFLKSKSFSRTVFLWSFLSCSISLFDFFFATSKSSTFFLVQAFKFSQYH